MSDALTTLEGLLTGNNSSQERVISGYNYYPKGICFGDCEVLTFSNMHETKNYIRDMISDLILNGYPNDAVLLQLRDKYGFYKWELEFNFRDDEGKIYPNLRVKNTRTNKYLDLSAIPFKTLKDAGYTEEQVRDLAGENQGWEINLGCENIDDVVSLAELFIRKSSKYPFDEFGIPLPETDAQKEARKPWSDAYDTPVLIIGGDVHKIRDKVPLFVSAKIIRREKDGKELSFVIRRRYEQLIKLPEYKLLLAEGFIVEDCLANIPFIFRYVDK